MLNMGPLTETALERFMVKLGKALYVRHNRQVFECVIYASHISSLEQSFTPEHLDGLLRFAPVTAETRRSGKSLADQFVYRFNHNAQIGAVYAVVRFSEQFIFQIVGADTAMDARLRADRQLRDLEPPNAGRSECRLAAYGEAAARPNVLEAFGQHARPPLPPL